MAEPFQRSQVGWLGFFASFIFSSDWRQVLLGLSSKYQTWKPITGRLEERDRGLSNRGDTLKPHILNCFDREVREETGLFDTAFTAVYLLDPEIVYHKPPVGNEHAPFPVVTTIKPGHSTLVPNHEFVRFDQWDIGDVVNGWREVTDGGIVTVERMNPIYAANHCAVIAQIARELNDNVPRAAPFAATFPRGFRDPDVITIFDTARGKLIQQYDQELCNRFAPRAR